MKALGTRVLILRDKATGSHVVPEEQWETPTTGLVMSVGSDVTVHVKEGDTVKFGAYAVTEVENRDGQAIIVVDERDLLVKL